MAECHTLLKHVRNYHTVYTNCNFCVNIAGITATLNGEWFVPFS